MTFSVFYSWQSDLPNNTNRNFIKSVLEASIKDLSKSDQIEVIPRIEQDTQGVPGSPSIADKIFEKILACDCFVADISLVTPPKSKRASPNPNVLVELGFAIRHLGWDRIVLFSNDYGRDGEEFPFDIRNHRRASYSLAPESQDKASIRKKLASGFSSQLLHVVNLGRNKLNERQPTLNVFWNLKTPDYAGENSFSRVEKIILRNAPNSFPPIREPNEMIAQLPDGADDPDWKNKVIKYYSDYSQFRNDLREVSSQEGAIFLINHSSYAEASIGLENTGTAPATEIKVELEIPDWLEVVELLPTDEIPTPPDQPKPAPKPKASTSFLDSLNNAGSFLNDYKSFDSSLSLRIPELARHVNRDWGLSREKGKPIVLWADKLTHHRSTPSDDLSLFFLARDAPIGSHFMKGKIYHEKEPTFEEILLEIEIVE